MNFSEAVKEMMNGHLVSRDAYDKTGEYYTILPGMHYVWKIAHIPNPAAGNWLPLVEDLLAMDWKPVSRVPVMKDAEVSL
jgi:hypothetical protein